MSRMQWWAIIKNEDITDLKNEVVNMLEQSETIGGTTPEGEYDDELDGYRDSGETYVTDYISLEPAHEHEEHNEVTIEFDLNFFDYENQLHLGSYTGDSGYYFTFEDWGEADREALLAVKEHLEAEA